MTKQTEALKLALEALETLTQYNMVRANIFRRFEPTCTGDYVDLKEFREKAEPVITAIREALAEQPAQQQEPVVWMYVNKSTHETKFQKHMRDFVDHSLWSEVPLYGEPLANHELQCVCGAVWCGDEMVHLPDKHPPASKPWVGLTRHEFNECVDGLEDLEDCWTAIEAKLREKNA